MFDSIEFHHDFDVSNILQTKDTFSFDYGIQKNVEIHDERVCDRILFQTENFVVIPSLGSIVEGYLLIVPKKEFLCIGAFDDDLFFELNILRNFISKVVEDCFGPIILFEHGPSKCNQEIGCGVDYAHLHIVPVKFNLINNVNNFTNNKYDWKNINDYRELKRFYLKGRPYLYIEQPFGKGYAITDKTFESQLLRKVIAFSIGKPDRYNWRMHPEENNIRSTINKIEKWKIKKVI